MKFKDQLAIVTGAGSGIGEAIALRLADEGATVGVIDLDQARADQTVAKISTAGGQALAHTADISDRTELDKAVSELVAAAGPLTIMVNNAGILDGYQDVDEIEEDAWRRVLDINLTGVYLGCKRALQEMLPAGTGRIINMASIAGLNGTGGGAAYIATKHAVVGLTKQMAVVYGDRGITVNCVCPGVIPTNLRANSTSVLGAQISNMAARGIGTTDELIRANVPAGVRGDAMDIANAVAFLASAEAAYVNGHSLVVDGGLRAK
jgi:NAD(P)-dependent dehydrogenase (short-subunit alcohol dehydrogenase family)